MSYTKNTWQTGDIVSSVKLNNMENGIEAAQLPDVTSDDNGDVLTVVDGAWSKAAPSGGGGIYWITLTYDEVERKYSSDKSYNDLMGALSDGLLPLAVETGTTEVETIYSYGLLTELRAATDENEFGAAFHIGGDDVTLTAESANAPLVESQSE